MYIPLLYLIGCGQTEVEDDTPESSEKMEVTSTEKSEPQSETNQETKTYSGRKKYLKGKRRKKKRLMKKRLSKYLKGKRRKQLP